MITTASVMLANLDSAGAALDLARHVERAGFQRIWFAETNGLDAGSINGAIAASTRLEVGTAIVPIYNRSPVILAMMASSWSDLAGGRTAHLGVGAGGQVLVERWHGTPFEHPVGVLRDSLIIIRQALSGRRTNVVGTYRSSDGFRLRSGSPTNIRVYLGGLGPAMVTLASEAADGLIVTWSSPRIVEEFRTELDGKVIAAQRPPGAVRLLARAYVGICDEVGEVRARVRREMVEYLLSPAYGRHFRRAGFGAEVDAVNDAFAGRDRSRAVAAVSDRLIDEFLIVGHTSADIAPRLLAMKESGADEVIVQIAFDKTGANAARTIDAVAAVFRG